MANGTTGQSPSGHSKLLAPAAGAGTGAIFFWLLNVFFVRDFIPHIEDAHHNPMGNVVRPEAAAGPAVPKSAYDRICITCHQADGKGMPGTFPPLAGSEWVTGDPETPIRIVLLGIGGAIEVNGEKFNAVMPPPAGLSDADIAEAVTHARTQFGNSASEVTEEQVAAVRAALGGRTKPWTAEELAALRPAAAPADAPAPDAEGSEAEGEAPQDAPAEAAPSEAAPAEATPAKAAPAPKAEPAPAAEPAAPAAAPAAPAAAPAQEPAP
jgi:mono/diheme cytochrome c family protein